MKKIKYPILAIMVYICFSFMLVGCTNEITDEVTDEKVIVLNKGAYVNEKSNEYTIYNINDDNNFEVVDTNEVIIAYNNLSSTYIYVEDGDFYVKYNNKEKKVDEETIYHQKISPKGNYLFYFINDKYLTPMIMDLKDSEVYSLHNQAIISGEFIDWISESKLAYYGVDNENRITGIFTYDLVSLKEELIYKIDLGYIQYLKSMGNGVFFLQETYGDDAILKCITSDGVVTEICSGIEEINDIEVTEEGTFILGRIKNNTYSLYRIEDGGAQRLIYDFPSIINIQKGIAADINGDIMFIGGRDNIKEQYIYKYSKGNVSIITKEGGDYNFIEIN